MRRTITVLATGALVLSGVAIAAPAATAAKVLKPGAVTAIKVTPSASHNGTAAVSWKAPAVVKGKTLKATSYALACPGVAVLKTTKTALTATVTTSIVSGGTCSVTAYAGKVAGPAAKSNAFSAYHQYGVTHITLAAAAVGLFGGKVTAVAPGTLTPNSDGTATLAFPVVTSADTADQTNVIQHAGALSIAGAPLGNLTILEDPHSTFDNPLFDLVGTAVGKTIPVLQLGGVAVSDTNANETDYATASIYPDPAVAGLLAPLLGITTTAVIDGPSVTGVLNPSKSTTLVDASGTTGLVDGSTHGDTSIVAADWIPAGSVITLDSGDNAEYFVSGTAVATTGGYTIPVLGDPLLRDHSDGASIAFAVNKDVSAGQTFIYTAARIPHGSIVTIGTGPTSETFVAGVPNTLKGYSITPVQRVGGLQANHSFKDKVTYSAVSYAGATSIVSSVLIPEGSHVTIGGANSETFTSGKPVALGDSGPWTIPVTTVGGLTKTHIGGVDLTGVSQITVPALVQDNVHTLVQGLLIGSGNTIFN